MPERSGVTGGPRGKVYAFAGLGFAALAWVILIANYRSHLGFITDDWMFIFQRMDGGFDSLADPYGEHVVLLFAAAYRVLVEIFGISSTLPFHALSMLMLLLAAGALGLYLRQLVGDFGAGVATIVVLFLGAGYDNLLWIFQTCFSISIATGLAALLLLRADVRGRDVAACLLLCVSTLTVSLGLPFLVGAGVLLALSPDRWRRCWIVLVPLALFLAWYVGWGSSAESWISVENAIDTPAYVFNAFSYSLGVLTGLFKVEGAVGDWTTRLLAIAVLAAIAIRARRRRKIPTYLLVGLAAGLCFWGLAGLNQIPIGFSRDFDESRYQIPNAVITLMIVGGGFEGIRIRGVAKVVVTVIAAIAISTNLVALSQGNSDAVRPISDQAYFSFTALDLLGPENVDPAFEVSVDGIGVQSVSAGTYFATAERFGSAGFSADEIPEQSASFRYGLDGVLGAANRFVVGAGPDHPTADCRVVSGATGEGPETFPLTDEVWIDTRQSGDVFAGRFGDGETIPIAAAGTGWLHLAPPGDGLSEPWRIRASEEGFEICRKASPA